jgi:phospholipid/cholesterol/gamma-HCH transport system substrate-binding protein
MKIEAKVGLFVFLGLLAFFLLSTQVNSFGGMGKKGYTVSATMDTVLGLDKNAKVKMNGIDIGYVQDMTLAGRDVKVLMFIFEEVQIPIDSTIVMAQDSMLGSRFINLIAGVEDKMLISGGNLTKEKHLSSLDETSTSINDAALELKGFIKELRETFREDATKSVKTNTNKENRRFISNKMTLKFVQRYLISFQNNKQASFFFNRP